MPVVVQTRSARVERYRVVTRGSVKDRTKTKKKFDGLIKTEKLSPCTCAPTTSHLSFCACTEKEIRGKHNNGNAVRRIIVVKCLFVQQQSVEAHYNRVHLLSEI